MIRQLSTAASLALLLATHAQAQADNRFFDSDGTRIHYVDVGAGEPVLLIHGFGVNLRRNWVGPGIVAGLANAGYRVVAYDARGHGRSEKPHDPAKYGPVEVDDAIRLLDHLGIVRAHVIGYSRGGMIANRLRIEYPQRVRTVILAGYGDGGRDTARADFDARAAIADSLAAGNAAPFVRWLNPGAPPEEVAAIGHTLVDNNDARAIAAAFRADRSFPSLTPRELRGHGVPMLAVVGGLDRFMEDVERMRAVMNDFEVLVVPGAGHISSVGRPELLTGLLGFLSKHAAGRADRPD